MMLRIFTNYDGETLRQGLHSVHSCSSSGDTDTWLLLPTRARPAKCNKMSWCCDLNVGTGAQAQGEEQNGTGW